MTTNEPPATGHLVHRGNDRDGHLTTETRSEASEHRAGLRLRLAGWGKALQGKAVEGAGRRAPWGDPKCDRARTERRLGRGREGERRSEMPPRHPLTYTLRGHFKPAAQGHLSTTYITITGGIGSYISRWGLNPMSLPQQSNARTEERHNARMLGAGRPTTFSNFIMPLRDS